MAENPDVTARRGYSKFTPRQGELRFVERQIIIEGTDVPKRVRILQQWQFSSQDQGFGWYDIPLEVNDG